MAHDVPFRAESALITQSPLKTSVPNTNHAIHESESYLFTQLSVAEIDIMEPHLWIAGLHAGKVRPLHRQKLVRRDIVIAEKVNLHLIWDRDSIFLKPIPHALLHYQFFKDHIAPHPSLYYLAMAFLSTYLRLIQYESDFNIASTLGLIPNGVTWDMWLLFAQQIDAAQKTIKFTGRYAYGELRLSRLNLIARIFHGRISRGFVTLDTNYRTYFSPIIATAFLAFGYAGIALSAFQIVVGSTAHPVAIAVGYWFAVSVLILLGLFTVAVVGWFILLLLDNVVFIYYQRRKR